MKFMGRRRILFTISFGLLLSLAVSGCNVTGGSGDLSTVRLEGTVDDGTVHSPIANASCRFMRGGAELATTTAGANGLFNLNIAPNVRGFIECHPPGLPNLKLSAFASTMGRQVGDVVRKQSVTPATTSIADIISATKPANPEAEHEQLSEELAAGGAEIALLVDAATSLYNALLRARLDTDFAAALLNDLFVDGSLDLPPLAPIAAQVEKDIAAAEQQRGVGIKAAAALLGINVAPTAMDDTQSTPRNTPVTITVLDNDTDENGDPLRVTSVIRGLHGTVDITDHNATVTYTPSADFVGTDTFTYTISDPAGLTATATVTMTVEEAPVNQRPEVVSLIENVREEAGAQNIVFHLNETFTDPDGDMLTFAVVGNTHPCVVTATVTGTTPDPTLTLYFQNLQQSCRAPQSNIATITVQASDSRGGTVTATFKVVVTPRVNVEELMHAIGETVDHTLTAVACGSPNECTFRVSGLPPDLQVDQTTGRITGNIAYTAFTRGEGGGPHYRVTVTASKVPASDTTTHLDSTGEFTWRITQGEVVAGSPSGAGSGGDGSPAVGDAGVGGDAGDGADDSPLRRAICRFVNMNGQELNPPRTTVADCQGKYFLSVPPNLEGFVVCHPGSEDINRNGQLDPGEDCNGNGGLDPERSELVVSTFVTTEGLRPTTRDGQLGEVLKGQSVNPRMNVLRSVIESAKKADLDVVALKGRFQQEIEGLRVGISLNDSGEIVGIPLKPNGSPTTPVGNNASIVA